MTVAPAVSSPYVDLHGRESTCGRIIALLSLFKGSRIESCHCSLIYSRKTGHEAGGTSKNGTERGDHDCV
jgi:hypothetical protein